MLFSRLLEFWGSFQDNEDKDEDIITGIIDDELYDYYNMETDYNTISDEQLKRMFDSDDDVIIVKLELLQKCFNICKQIFEVKVNIL